MGEEEGQQQSPQNIPEGEADGLRAYTGKAPHQKGIGPQPGIRRQDGDGIAARPKETAHRHPRQHNGDAGGSGAGRQGVDDAAGKQRAAEGRQGHQLPPSGKEEGGSQHKKAAAGIDPNDVGAGQGIGQHPLEHRPAHRKGSPRQERGGYPRQPDMAKNPPRALGHLSPQKKGDGIPQGHLHRAKGDGQNQQQKQQGAKEEQQGGITPPPWPLGRGFLPDTHSFPPICGWVYSGTAPQGG